MFPPLSASFDEARRIFQSVVPLGVRCCQVRKKRPLDGVWVWEVTYMCPSHYTVSERTELFSECRIHGGKVLSLFEELSPRGVYVAVVYAPDNTSSVRVTTSHSAFPCLPADQPSSNPLQGRSETLTKIDSDISVSVSGKIRSYVPKRKSMDKSCMTDKCKFSERNNHHGLYIKGDDDKKYPLKSFPDSVKPLKIIACDKDITYLVTGRSRLSYGAVKVLVERNKTGSRGKVGIISPPTNSCTACGCMKFVPQRDNSTIEKTTDIVMPATSQETSSLKAYDYNELEMQYRASKLMQPDLLLRALSLYKMRYIHKLPKGGFVHSIYLQSSDIPLDEVGLRKLLIGVLKLKGYSPTEFDKILSSIQ